MSKKVGLMEIINSKYDSNGNRYWMFCYTDFATGQTVEAVCTGSGSNIENAIPFLPDHTGHFFQIIPE